jgi:hypothetical protein
MELEAALDGGRHGNLPGSAPGTLYVAASGTPLPLAATEPGPQKPGGAPDRFCGEAQASPSTASTSDLTFSRYNLPV